jgi:hypothetical protein
LSSAVQLLDELQKRHRLGQNRLVMAHAHLRQMHCELVLDGLSHREVELLSSSLHKDKPKPSLFKPIQDE